MPRRPSLAVAIALAILSTSTAFAGPFVLDRNITTKALKTPGIVKVPQLRATCPDIRVTTHQNPRSDGSILVTIKVVNTSSADFISGAGQQALIVKGNGRNARVAFGNVVRGSEVVFQDIFHPFEFPATYNARISFDPDIFTDGNPQNDDCRASNNQASLTTAR